METRGGADAQVNDSEMRLKSSWMAVVLPMKVPLMSRPTGGMLHTAVFTFDGIHSTNEPAFFACIANMLSSTSRIDICRHPSAV